MSIFKNERSAQGWTLALTSMASLMVALDGLVVATALGTIRVDLHASIESLQWTVNSYTLTLAVLLMAAAGLGDRLGRRRMFAVGLAIFTAASIACALATSAALLIAARAVQGVGGALVVPLALSLLSHAFPIEKKARAIGVYSGITGLAVAGGPVVGGAIAQGLDWQWIFWINVPIGIVLIPLVLSRVEESHGSDTSLDIVGALLSTGAGFGVVWGLVRGNSSGWGSAEVIGTLAAGVVLAGLFVGWEMRARVAMMPTRMFRSRSFSAGNVANFALYASLFGTVFFAAQFFQSAQGLGPMSAGIRLIAWTATLFFVAPLAGAAVERVGLRPLVVCGLFLQSVGLAWIAIIADVDLSYPALILPFIVGGAGTSMAMPAVQAAVMSSVDGANVGKASATFNMLRQLGSAVGIAVVVATFAAKGGYDTAGMFVDGFRPAIGVASAIALIGAIAGIAIPPMRRVVPEKMSTDAVVPEKEAV
ncbi:MFS transporter [Nocardia sp. BSTN01]|uniref:MFS transporter n=1 Tax=Nocardia sp. BSTN01 TaxID=2783665 RepID=UPI00281655CB|nr:MFS transporter [Nocardia sp. BSTN01]